MKKVFDYDQYYSYGSLAYDYDYNCAEQEQQKKISGYKKNAQKSMSMPALICFLAVIFFGSMVTLSSFCLVNAKSNSIIILQEKLKAIRANNIILEEEISKKFDLASTKKIAETRLGMHAPLPYQIVHIKKPKQGYMIKYNW